MITLCCTQCAAPLEVTEDLEMFACGHCGTVHQVQRSGGTVSLDRVEQQLDSIKSQLETQTSHIDRQTSHIERQSSLMDRQHAEMAVVRIQREIATLNEEVAQAQKIVTMTSTARSTAMTRCISYWVMTGAFGLLSVIVVGASGTSEFVVCSMGLCMFPVIFGILALVSIFTVSSRGTQARTALMQYNKVVEAGRAKQAEYDKYYAILNGPSPP